MTIKNRSKMPNWPTATKKAMKMNSYHGPSNAFTQENTPTFATKKRTKKKKKISKHKRSTKVVPPPPEPAPTQPNPTVAAGVVSGPAPAATLPATTPTSNNNKNPATLTTPGPTEDQGVRLQNLWGDNITGGESDPAKMESEEEDPAAMYSDEESDKKPPANEDSLAMKTFKATVREAVNTYLDKTNPSGDEDETRKTIDSAVDVAVTQGVHDHYCRH